jgi:hypothetical protein
MSLFEDRMKQLHEAAIEFNATIADMELIVMIVNRFTERWGQASNPVSLAMEITACHLNGCPLRLEDLLKSSYDDFMQDIMIIRKNLNRTTGEN